MLELRSTLSSEQTQVAALGVVDGRGVGKTRHFDAQKLWPQGATRNREVVVQEVAREENVAEMLTKGAKSEVLEKHMGEMRFTKTQ